MIKLYNRNEHVVLALLVFLRHYCSHIFCHWSLLNFKIVDVRTTIALQCTLINENQRVILSSILFKTVIHLQISCYERVSLAALSLAMANNKCCVFIAVTNKYAMSCLLFCTKSFV